MLDILAIISSVICFVLAIAYTHACQGLKGTRP